MQIIAVQPEHIQPLATLLQEAFAHDEFYGWAFGMEPPETFRQHFVKSIEKSMKANLAFTTPDLKGAALWEAIHFEPMASEQSTYSGATERFTKGAKILDDHSPRTPHYYLSILASDTQSRGKGVGRSLIEHGLKLSKQRNVDAYLETITDENVVFYQRRGFEVIHNIPIEDGPMLKGMLHRP